MDSKLAERQVDIIKYIFQAAKKSNLFIFIKGGWNIDLSTGKQTRNHKDIDFHFDLKDKSFWLEFFKKRDFKVEKKDNWTLTFSSKNGVSIDFEGVKLLGDSVIWQHGGESKLAEVCNDKSYDTFSFKGMRLDVERYLKEKRKLREKDKKDLEVINTRIGQ